MAEIVSSAVVQETVSKILSSLVQKYEENEANVISNFERLEMAQIRLEAALEMSDKWQITDAPLLRWRKKLKQAALECEDTLHKCKKRVLEDEQLEPEVRKYSLPDRILHATKSFIFSIFKFDNERLSRSIVKRFEWYADGASEFLRFIEHGGTPRHQMPCHSLVRILFEGKQLDYKIIRGNGNPSFRLWLIPFITEEYGIEASLIFNQNDGTPEGNIYCSITIQLSESTDIVGITIKCLQLFAPHFKCKFENIWKELTQLPTQYLSLVPYVYSSEKEHWNNIHNLVSQWFRPNPLCCKQHGKDELRRISKMGMANISDVSLEQVTEFNLQCQVSLPVYSKQKTYLSEGIMSLQGSPYLNAGISFSPHGSSEDMLPANKSSVLVAIDGGEEHQCMNADIDLEQLEEIMLPKAISYFCQNAQATVYRMIWRFKHGFALILVEKPSISRQRTSMRTRNTFGRCTKRKLIHGKDQELESQTRMMTHLLDLWVAHSPVQLQRPLMDWMHKEKESDLAS
ncbi:unnamed protein product [Urochloa decumbens]|uniref:Disease resistance N-terminal domain-containing protein n=1 Tax=Urochloa decumbens TaxID=240449 RepID=A0ABC9FK92_9POAL